MTKIFLIRHAEAEGNIFRRAHGHHNGLVTLKGYKQIELLKERFINEQIDAVYSSDLSRALITSEALTGPRGIRAETNRALREVDLGVWEDRPWSDIEYSDYEMLEYFNNDPAKWNVKGSERYDDVAERMYNYIAKVSKRHDGKTIAVFSHGFAIRAFICKVMGIASNGISKIPYCDNTAVTLLTYENKGLTIDYAGDNSHLSAESSTLQQQSWWRAGERRKSEDLRYFPLSDAASGSLLSNFNAKAGERALVDTQYAAYLGDEPAGIIGLDTVRDSDRRIGWIGYIYVIPKHRKSTFGTQLIGLAVSEFRKLRREKLRIELPSGCPAGNFMGKCGFTVLLATEKSSLMEKDIKNW